MDDILKRLLAVEKSAQEVTDAAEKKAQELRAQARRAASELDEKAQADLIREHENVIAEKLQAARDERDRRLTEADKEMADKAAAFSKKIAGRLDAVVQALVFGGEEAAAK